jgi:hypothetical protein
MIIAGAGGHALELLDILISKRMAENLLFFDNVGPSEIFQEKYKVLNLLIR